MCLSHLHDVKGHSWQVRLHVLLHILSRGCVFVKEQQNIPSRIIFMIDYVPVLCSVLLTTYHLDNQIKKHVADVYVTCMGEGRDAYNIFVG